MSLSKNQIIAVAVVVVIVIAAAAAAVMMRGGGGDGPGTSDGVTIETQTSADGFIEQTFDDAPERIIVGNMTILETLLYFGLGDRIIAVYYLEDELWDNEYVVSEWEKVESRIGSENIAVGTFDQAYMVDLEPDLIMGYASSFSEDTFGTPTFWNDIGCNVWSTMCLNSRAALEHYPGTDMIDLMQMDYDNIGKVFGIEDRTSEYMDEFRALVDTIEADPVSSDISVAICEYHDANDSFSAYGDTSYSGWLLSLCGATNMFPSGGSQAIETIVNATDLDGFVLITYGDSSTITGFESEVIGNDIYAQVPPLAEDSYISWGLNGNYGGASAMDILQSLYDYLKEL